MKIVFFLSLAAWIIHLIFRKRYAELQNRRQITGYETARTILDARGFASVLIESTDLKHAHSQSETLFLPTDVCDGTSLKQILRAARASLQHARSKFWQISGDFPESLPLWTLYASVLAWSFLLLAVIFQRDFFWAAASFFWWGIFLTALFAFIEERENEKTILKFLKETHFFEVDEYVKLKKLLRGYRFSGFCLPFRYLSIGYSSLSCFFSANKEDS